jgi:hypothetical protein
LRIKSLGFGVWGERLLGAHAVEESQVLPERGYSEAQLTSKVRV